MKAYLVMLIAAALGFAACASPDTKEAHPGENGTCYQHGAKLVSETAYEFEGLYDPPLLYTNLSRKYPWIWPPWCQKKRNAKDGYAKKVNVRHCPKCTREYTSLQRG